MSVRVWKRLPHLKAYNHLWKRSKPFIMSTTSEYHQSPLKIFPPLKQSTTSEKGPSTLKTSTISEHGRHLWNRISPLQMFNPSENIRWLKNFDYLWQSRVLAWKRSNILYNFLTKYHIPLVLVTLDKNVWSLLFCVNRIPVPQQTCNNKLQLYLNSSENDRQNEKHINFYFEGIRDDCLRTLNKYWCNLTIIIFNVNISVWFNQFNIRLPEKN